MGHSSYKRKRQNQPEEEALDTTEDKSLKENEQPTEETAEEPIEETPTEETAEIPAEETETTEGIEEAETEETAEAPTEEPSEEEAEAEEEERKREEIPEEEIVEERIYTIPLSRAWIAPRKKRVPRAMSMVRAFVQKHMKIETGTKTEEEEEEEGRLVISEEVNRKLWSHGIEKPPRNLRVRAVKDKEGIVTLYLAEGD